MQTMGRDAISIARSVPPGENFARGGRNAATLYTGFGAVASDIDADFLSESASVILCVLCG